MQLLVDSLLIQYADVGNGPVVLLLHGWGDRHETFALLQAELKDSYRIIALDLPGFGRSQAPATAWDLDNYALVVEHFLAKLDISSLTAVIGHSNGGALAIRSLATGHLKAEKLVLLAASGVRDVQKVRRLGIQAVAKTGKVMTFWLPSSTRSRLQKKLYGSVGSDMLVAPALKETFKRTVRQDIQQDAKKLDIKTLLIYGDQDKATPVQSVGERLHKLIVGSELIVIPGADHFVHQIKANETNEAIKGFLLS